MKTLFAIYLIMATVFIVDAQDGKPTKEETVAYLKKSFELVEGERIEGDDNFTLNEYVFSTNSIIEIFTDGTIIRKTDFKWETLWYISELECKEPGEREICRITVKFHSPFKLDGNPNWTSLIVFVLKSRGESVRKAFLRLSEITKEENKDPFQD